MTGINILSEICMCLGSICVLGSEDQYMPVTFICIGLVYALDQSIHWLSICLG